MNNTVIIDHEEWSREEFDFWDGITDAWYCIPSPIDIPEEFSVNKYRTIRNELIEMKETLEKTIQHLETIIDQRRESNE